MKMIGKTATDRTNPCSKLSRDAKRRVKSAAKRAAKRSERQDVQRDI